MLACPKRSDASLRWMPACRATVAYAPVVVQASTGLPGDRHGSLERLNRSLRL